MADLESLLRPLLAPIDGQYPRPWMTDSRDPAAVRVFTVGRNQRIGFPVNEVGSLDAFVDALFNRGRETCRQMYDRITGIPSPTRMNTDRLVSTLAGHACGEVLQTNVVCFSTPMSSDLRHHPDGVDQGREIFRILFSEIRPRVMIAHGAGTARELNRMFGFPRTGPPSTPEQVSRSEHDGTELVVIPSLAPPAWNRWSGWAGEHMERVAQHVAAVLART